MRTEVLQVLFSRILHQADTHILTPLWINTTRLLPTNRYLNWVNIMAWFLQLEPVLAQKGWVVRSLVLSWNLLRCGSPVWVETKLDYLLRGHVIGCPHLANECLGRVSFFNHLFSLVLFIKYWDLVTDGVKNISGALLDCFCSHRRVKVGILRRDWGQVVVFMLDDRSCVRSSGARSIAIFAMRSWTRA